jgi:hypothetical protein
MYKVIESFTDIQDRNYPYSEGDTYPRNGVNVTDKRLAELSSGHNRRHKALIKKVDEPKKVEEPKEKPAPKRTPKRKDD